jgi:hypothetical protein
MEASDVRKPYQSSSSNCDRNDVRATVVVPQFGFGDFTPSGQRLV